MPTSLSLILLAFLISPSAHALQASSKDLVFEAKKGAPLVASLTPSKWCAGKRLPLKPYYYEDLVFLSTVADGVYRCSGTFNSDGKTIVAIFDHCVAINANVCP